MKQDKTLNNIDKDKDEVIADKITATEKQDCDKCGKPINKGETAIRFLITHKKQSTEHSTDFKLYQATTHKECGQKEATALEL